MFYSDKTESRVPSLFSYWSLQCFWLYTSLNESWVLWYNRWDSKVPDLKFGFCELIDKFYRLQAHYWYHFRICIPAIWPPAQSVCEYMIWIHLGCFLWLVSCFWMKHRSYSVRLELRRIIRFRMRTGFRLKPVSLWEEYALMPQNHYVLVQGDCSLFSSFSIWSSAHYAFIKHIFIFYITKQQSCKIRDPN